MRPMKRVPICLIFLSLLFFSGSLYAQEEKQSSKNSVLNVVGKGQWIGIERLEISDQKSRSDLTLQITTIVDISEDKKETAAFLEKYQKELKVKPKKIEFKISLLLAEKNQRPAPLNAKDLEEIIKGLNSFLKYDLYKLLDTFEIKFEGNLAEVTAKKQENYHSFKIEVRNPKIVEENNEKKLNTVIFLRKRKETLLKSELSLKDAQTTVVGVSKPGDDMKGIILIIRARLLER